MDDIEERLRSHAQAFDGLLSLIPAKYYYGDDTSDQWQRKKQTKEQARQAKRAKLDPDSAKTAKDVLDENARKRKRDQGDEPGDEDSSSSSDGELGSELPKEGLKRSDGSAKKQKSVDGPNSKTETATTKADEVEARKKLKEEKKARKKAAQKEKKKAKEEAKKAKSAESTLQAAPVSNTNGDAEPDARPRPDNEDGEDEEDGDDQEEAADVLATEEGFAVDFNPGPNDSVSPNTSAPNSPAFDSSAVPSGSSSISSIVPPTDTTKPASATEQKSTKPTPEELKQRLQKRLDELRARRHADGLNGKPARNRQELIEARRQKAEQRKAHKKLLRQKAKEEEQRIKDEAMARRFSPGGSGSLLASPRSPADSIGSGSNNFAFGRVVFADGQQADSSLSTIRDAPDKHGPRDPAAALKAAEAKKARLQSLDEQKRAEIEAKDMWLTAKKRAHGERVRDDTSLLKKALKRKESAKKKSEREWKERLEGVAKGRDIRQAKREENLRKRREEKGNGKGGGGGGGGGGKKKSAGTKRKARPGFEGSFKAKVGGKKK